MAQSPNSTPGRTMRIDRQRLLSAKLHRTQEEIETRSLIYRHLCDRIQRCSARSDFGWLLTLGSPPLGMLMAVGAGREARELERIADRLYHEIIQLEFIRTRLALQSSLAHP